MVALNLQLRINPGVINRRHAVHISSLTRLRVLSQAERSVGSKTGILILLGVRLALARRVVGQHHVKGRRRDRPDGLLLDLEGEGEASVRVVVDDTVFSKMIDLATVQGILGCLTGTGPPVIGTTVHEAELEELVLLTELGAQRGGRHGHRASLRNVEGAGSDLQINLVSIANTGCGIRLSGAGDGSYGGCLQRCGRGDGARRIRLSRLHLCGFRLCRISMRSRGDRQSRGHAQQQGEANCLLTPGILEAVFLGRRLSALSCGWSEERRHGYPI